MDTLKSGTFQLGILDHGIIKVVDIMGNDSAIVQAARVSYGAGTKTPSKDEKLINYLWKHKHTSPFEMCEIKLFIRCPIFIARQWLRHRTASINEYSGRYSIMQDRFYVPTKEALGEQLKTGNKQSRTSGMEDEQSVNDIIAEIEVINEWSYKVYGDLIEKHGLARELARMVLPSSLYTDFYWKIDLHNLLHFIKLRATSDAQYEIRVYAQAILDEIVKIWCPFVYKAYNNEVNNNVK